MERGKSLSARYRKPLNRMLLVRIWIAQLHQRRSKLHIACSDFYAHGKKSERTHSAAPPFPNRSRFAGLQFGFWGMGERRTPYRSRRRFFLRNNRHLSLILSQLLPNPKRKASDSFSLTRTERSVPLIVSNK